MAQSATRERSNSIRDGLGVRLAVNLLQQSAGFSRSADESTDDGADSGWYNRLSAKGEPGVDSVNSCLPEDRTRCKYAAFSDFLIALAILASSGVEVLTIHDDFQAYYEMFAIGEFDKWYSAQIGRHGSTQATSCEFGIAHLPDALNRVNFMMCKLIEQRATSFIDDLRESPTPWSLECVSKCITFAAIRRVTGGHGSPFCQFPWFDDNVAGVLAPFASRFRQLRYDTWEQFRWDVALEKAAVNFWGSQRNLEPVVGFEIRLSDRTWWYPEEKMRRLLDNVADITAEAAAHPQRLMHRETVLTVLCSLRAEIF